MLIFEKYKVEDALKQINEFEKVIQESTKVSSDGKEDSSFSGPKNIAKFCSREMLKHNYIFDRLK